MYDNGASVQQSINLFARVIAVVMLMVLPGIGGAMLDRKLGSHFVAPIGFGIGMMFGIFGLWILIKRAGQGMPIPKRPLHESKSPGIFADEDEELDPDADSQSN